jgi:aspartate/methionine/tyrosine aminotransferase
MVKQEYKRISNRLQNILSLPALEAAKMREMALRTKDVIKLTSGEPNFVTPAHIREAAKKALDDGYTFYTPTSGLPEFKEAVAEKIVKEHHIEIEPNSEVIATPGGIEGIFLAIMGVINPGDEVLIPDPCYVGYPTCIRFADGIPVSVPLSEDNDFRLEPSEVEKRITKATKMIILNSPSNPTGTVMGHRDLEAMVDIAERNDLLILSDEAYEKIVYDDAKHHSVISFPGMKERTILIGSLSKTYAMTGWRIGYLVGDENLVQNLGKIQSSITLCVNAVVQRAAVAALKGSHDFVDEMLREYDKRRQFIVKKLNAIDDIHCSMPRGAFFVFPSIKEIGVDSLRLTEFLMNEAKVAVYPGIAFGAQGEHHIRLSYSTSIELLDTALERMRKALEKLTPSEKTRSRTVR